APGPVTDAVLAEAVRSYVELVRQVAQAGGDALALVPTGLPAGAIDAALHDGVLAALPDVAVLPGGRQTSPPTLLRPREAHLLEGELGQDRAAVGQLARFVTDLAWVPRAQRAVALRLGARAVSAADVVDALPLTDAELLDALDPHASDPHVAEACAALPVRLADGRTVRGARGVVVATPRAVSPATGPRQAPDLDAFAPWGLRVAASEAAHPLLLRLGALPDDGATVLATAEVTRALDDLARCLDDAQTLSDLDDDALAVRHAVLDLVRQVAASGEPLGPRVRARLASVPLTADGELLAARDLVLPGSFAHEVFDALPAVDDAEVERWGADALRLLGVRDDLVVHREDDVVAEEDAADADVPLEGWADYLAHLAQELGEDVYVGEVDALADLDAVADDAWPRVLERVAQVPALRAALVDPVDGARSYASWWLRDRFEAPFTRPGASVPFVPPAPVELAGADLPDDVWVAVGAIGTLGQVQGADWEAVLGDLPPIGREVDLGDARRLWRALEGAAHAVRAAHPDVLPEPPERMVALQAGAARVVEAERLAVTAEPMWAQVEPVVPAGSDPDAVADLLDLPVREACAERWSARGGEPAALPAVLATVLATLPDARRVGDPPSGWMRHDAPFPVGPQGKAAGAGRATWWVDPDGTVHACGTLDLASALAQRDGAWAGRHVIAAALLDARVAERLEGESAWD
ncbi:MAG: sacsin N-terminal ATP-binding-like domain-containing protein, partial [Cellulomonadaceae bacterium]